MPSVTRPHTKCRKCEARFDAHEYDMSCPDGSDRTFSKHTPRLAASNSWSEGEIQVLDFIVNALLRGGNAQMATRHQDFASIVRKVGTAKQRIADMKAERAEEKEQESVEAKTGSA